MADRINSWYKANRKSIYNLVYILLWGILILWPLLLLYRGIDVSDTGYILSRYKYFFVDPSNNGIRIFLSDALGGIIYNLFPSHQLLIMRLGFHIASLVTIYICIRMSDNKESRIWRMIAALIAQLFSISFLPLLSYHIFPAMFLCCAIFFLVRGMKSAKTADFIISGALIGFNVFVRVSNILEAFLVCAIIWYYGICKNDWKNTLKRSGQFLGSLAAIAGIFLIFGLVALGVDKVLDELGWLTSISGADVGRYSISVKLSKFYSELVEGLKFYLKAAYNNLIILLGALACNIVNQRLRNAGNIAVSRIAGIVGILLLLVFCYNAGSALQYYQSLFAISIAVFFISILFIFGFRKSAPLFSTLSLIICIGLCAEIFASSNLTINIINFLCFPLIFVAEILYVKLSETIPKALGQKDNSLFAKSIRHLTIICAFVLLGIWGVSGVIRAATYVYRDLPYRELTAKVEIPELYGMRTSQKRARQLELFYREIAPYKEYSLLAYGSVSLFHVLTPMLPALGHYWPDLASFSVELFEQRLAGLERTGLPIIVMANLDDMAARNDDQDVRKRNLIAQFIEKNGYDLLYEDETYKIFKPNN